MSDNKRDLTSGSVVTKLFDMSWPMMMGIAASMSVPLADSYFLGQLGTEPLAAISFTFPVVLSLLSLCIGLGAGTASVVSRAIGDGDDARARKVGTNALMLCVIITVFIALVGYLTAEPLFAAIGATGAVAERVIDYMFYWYVGLPLLAVVMVGSNLLRSNGDARTASVIMIGVAVVNVAIDPLLIFGFGWIPALEVEGAAIASLIARIIAAAATLWAITCREKLLSFTFAGFPELWKSWVQVGRIAIPAALGNAVNPVGITIVTGFLAGYGETVVAGFGVATRIESFVAIPMLALSSAIGPVAGQSFGARKYVRVTDAHLRSYIFCAIWSVVIAVAMWLAAEPLAGLFTDDSEVIDVIVHYLTVVPISLVGFGITVVAAGGMNAIGQPLYGLLLYLIRTVLLYVPVAWFLSRQFESDTVFLGIAGSNIVAAVLVGGISIFLLKRQCRMDDSRRSQGE